MKVRSFQSFCKQNLLVYDLPKLNEFVYCLVEGLEVLNRFANKNYWCMICLLVEIEIFTFKRVDYYASLIMIMNIQRELNYVWTLAEIIH